MAASVPPSGVDPVDHRHGFPLDAVGRGLDRPRSPERIDGVDHTGLVRDDLLRAQRACAPLLGRQRQRFVPVAVQRLRAAEHRRQRLQRHPDDVVVGLLRGQSVLPAVWVWKRSCCARGLVAPNRSRMIRAHSRRAARNFATSSRKSLCALKKNDSRCRTS